MNKFDALDTEGGDIPALLSALPRVEAPQNFDFGVKAKLAQGYATPGALMPFLKLAAPLGLVLLIGAFVVFYGLLPTAADAPAVADAIPTSTNSIQIASELPAPPQQAVSQPQPEQRAEVQPDRVSAAAETRGPVRRSSKPSAAVRPGGGSFDISLGSAKPKLPPGFDGLEPRNSSANSGAGSTNNSVRELLEILGINASVASGDWKVASVAENTIASRAKVLSGDVILAINGQQLKGDSAIKGSITNLTIRRDGKTMNVKLGN